MLNSSQSKVAEYRYDPFGKTISKSGSLADANVYRFSSKECLVNDTEFSGVKELYYYGYRWYEPNLQRWPNRDPIAERGGLNLYGFAYNNAVNNVDRNGLDVVKPPDPYDGYDKKKDITTYNCAGIALRNYKYLSIEDTKKELGKGKSTDCSKDCEPCGVKCWLWEYKLGFQDKTGTMLSGWSDDFHVVCAPVSCEDGKELKNCYCKNGRRPVIGPVTPSTQKPPEKEIATANDPSEKPITLPNGDPVYKVRKDYKESCFCLPPTTSPPAKK
jgi:RHS repeat-associated protein